MDMPKLTQDRNFTVINVGKLTMWFSYETLIAFRVAGGETRIIQNYWGTITGRHLNDVSRTLPRLTRTEFMNAWEREVSSRFDQAGPKPTSVANDLGQERQQAAEQVFAEYDFEPEVVEETGGWETVGKKTVRRTVFMRSGETNTTKQGFVVQFKPGTAEVKKAFVE